MQNPLFSSQVLEGPGYLIISSYRKTPAGTTETILTKLDNEGIKNSDLILPNTFLPQMTISNNNQLVLLQTNNALVTYDADLKLIENKALDFGDGFQHTLAFGSNSIFRHRHLNNGVHKLSKFDYQGKLNWEVSYKFVGCGGSTIYVLNKGNDISLLAESYPDSIKISHLNNRTGEKYWNKLFMKQDILPYGGNVIGTWNSMGKLVLAAFRGGGQLMIDIYDGSHKRKVLDVEFSVSSYLNKILPTQDGGILLGITLDQSLEPSNFKLVKLDREGNPGWIGTFNQVGNDFLTDLIELKDGTIVALTANGYVQALSPN